MLRVRCKVLFTLILISLMIQLILHNLIPLNTDSISRFLDLAGYGTEIIGSKKWTNKTYDLETECETVQVSNFSILIENRCNGSLMVQNRILDARYHERYCRIEDKLSLSAYVRAETKKCKMEILRTVCLAKIGMLYQLPMPTRPCNRGFNDDYPPTDQDYTPAKILFIIVAHGRDLRQFLRLLMAIYSKDHYYYIHVDKRDEYLCNKTREFVNQRKERNIAITSWNLAPFWGSSSFLNVLLKCMKDVMILKQFSNWKWDFYINLSGSDYPIKTIDQLTAYLSLRRGKNFVSTMTITATEFIKRQGLNFLFYECDGHMWRIGKRNITSYLQFYGGSDWVILSYQFCKYLVTSADSFITNVNLFYKYTLLPAESFFHVVLRNSEFCNTIIYNNLRLINWKTDLSCHCQYRKIVDWCGCSPSNFRRSDISKIDLMQDTFFARKFESIVNQEILNLIDERILGKKLNELNRNYYWQSICSSSELTAGRCDRYKLYLESCMRLARNNVTSSYNRQTIDRLNFLELYVINKEDIFGGILLSFLISTNVVVEVWMQKLQLAWTMPLTKGAERLYDLQVGSFLDKKEQIFRSHGILSINDDLIVLQRWKLGPKFECNLTWLNPNGEIAKQKILIIEADWRFSYFRAELSKPLDPGKWKIHLSIGNVIFSEIKFILLPSDNSLIRSINLSLPFGYGYLTNFKLNRDKLSDRYTDNLIYKDNFRKSFERWVDSLILESWKIYKICFKIKNEDVNNTASQRPLFNNEKIDKCDNSEWSSFTKDYKSDFRPIS